MLSWLVYLSADNSYALLSTVIAVDQYGEKNNGKSVSFHGKNAFGDGRSVFRVNLPAALNKCAVGAVAGAGKRDDSGQRAVVGFTRSCTALVTLVKTDRFLYIFFILLLRDTQ